MHDIQEIRVGLAAARRELARYFSGLSSGELVRAVPGEWAPIDDLRHLNRSVAPVASALRLPKLALGLRFGRARRPSDTYDDLLARYTAGLREGTTAPPEFVPPEVEIDDRESYRTRVLERWVTLGGELNEALERWDDPQLDVYQLPHPALGRLTVREMLFFTHFHTLHHMRVAQRRVRTAAQRT